MIQGERSRRPVAEEREGPRKCSVAGGSSTSFGKVLRDGDRRGATPSRRMVSMRTPIHKNSNTAANDRKYGGSRSDEVGLGYQSFLSACDCLKTRHSKGSFDEGNPTGARFRTSGWSTSEAVHA